jgi:hypothetical protein
MKYSELLKHIIINVTVRIVVQTPPHTGSMRDMKFHWITSYIMLTLFLNTYTYISFGRLIYHVTFSRKSPKSNINVVNCMCALLFSTPRKDRQSTGVVHVWQFICLLFTEHLDHWLGAKRNLACFFPQQLSEIYRVTNLAIFLLLL